MADSGRSVEALVKTKAVLDALSELGPCSIKAISEYVGEPSSSTYRLLSNLIAMGWVDRGVRRGEYRLGIECIKIAGQIERRLDVQQIARHCFRDQHTKLGAWSLFVRRQLRAVCLQFYCDSQILLQCPEVGYSLPISVGAPSNVLLAFLPEARFEEVIEHYRYVADQGGLLATFRHKAVQMATRVRERGFSYDVDETVPGVLSLAAPVYDHQGEVRAAVCLSGFPRSLAGSVEGMGRDYPEVSALLGVCDQISRGLGAQDSSVVARNEVDHGE